MKRIIKCNTRIASAVFPVVACLFGVASLPAQSLATLDYTVTGQTMQVSPAALAVPKGIAGSVGVTIPGETPPGAFVEAVLRGPSFPARRLVGAPNAPLVLPPLNLAGNYSLDGIRLAAATGETLLEGSPSTVPVQVFDEVLVSRVTSRPLALAEIEDKGIFLDGANFRALEFEIGFVLDGETFPVRFPLVTPQFKSVTEIVPAAELEERLAEVERINNQLAANVKMPPELETVNPNIQVMPFHIQKTRGGVEDLALTIPPIPALLVIPGNVGFLNQFFSVQIFTENGAPGGSGLSVRDIRAELLLPPGPDRVAGNYEAPGDDPVRFARVGASAEIRNVIAIRAAGPDGKSGTADDVERLQPGQAGQGEFLVEGLQEGLHVLDLKLTAQLDGLAAGPVEVEGLAAGSVQVSNPKFSLAFSHPRTIRTGEPYEASVTILNTSNTVANLVSIALNPLNISGGLLQSEERVELGTIRPGETATATFKILSQRTGAITFSNITTSDDSLVGRFRLRVGVDERGVALSRNTLLLPDFVNALPPELLAAANRVLGQAMSVATAPQLPPGVIRVPRSFVSTTTTTNSDGKTLRRGGGSMVMQLAEAAERVRYGEPLARVLPDLLLDWQGGRDFSPGWDQIIGETDAGREWREAMMRAIEAASPAPANPVTRLTARGVDLAGRGEDWFLAAVSRGEFQGDTPTGELNLITPTATSGVETGKVAKTIGYGGRDGAWMVAGTSGIIEWRFDTALAGATQLSVMILAADGTGREILWDLADIPAGTVVRFDPSGTGTDIQIDENGDGTGDRLLGGQVTPFTEAPPTVLMVRQDPEIKFGRPDRKCFPVTTTNEAGQTVPVENHGNILVVLFSKPMTQETAGNAAAYEIEGTGRAASVQVQPGGRVAIVALREPVSLLIQRELTIREGVTDLRGNPFVATAMPIQTLLVEGFRARGRVLRPDGSAGVNLPVTLTYDDRVASTFGCKTNEVRVSQTFTDGTGAFEFDFVLSGIPFSLSTTDVTNVRDNEAIAIILESSLDGAVTEERLKTLGASVAGTEEQANVALRRAFGVESISQAVALAEGLDRAVVRDFGAAGRQGAESVYVLRFRGRATVTGQVLAADGVSPVGGAAVNLFPDPASRELGRGIFSDTNGFFTFYGVPLGTTSVEATNRAGNTRTVSTLIATSGETVNLPIVLSAVAPSLATLQGRVTEADGTPHARATVVVETRSPAGSVVDFSSASMVTADEDGFFSVSDVPAGVSARLVAISVDGRRKGERRDVSVTAGVLNTANITLQARATVRGRVEFANGDPVAGAIVGGGEELVTTDSLGAFVLEGVPTGKSPVSAGLDPDPASSDPRRRLARLGSTRLDVLPGDDNFAVIRFDPAGRIAGQVLDENGNPVGNTDVAIPLDRGTEEVSFFAWVNTNAQGNFVFDNIGLGSWNVTTPAPPHEDLSELDKAQEQILSGELDQIIAGLTAAFATYTGAKDPFLNGEGEKFNPARWGLAPDVKIEFDGQTVVVPVRYFKTATLSGTVTNGQDVPIGARVRLTGLGPRPNGYPAMRIRGELDSDPALGTFEFKDQAFVGDWGLQAASPFFPVVISKSGRTTQADPVISDILLKFPPVSETNGSLSGQVFFADGTPAGAGVRVQISFGPDFVIRTDDSGRFATTKGTFTLPAGRYTVTALDEASGATARIDTSVAGGQDNAVTLTLLGRGDARITVRKADGTPAANAAVEIEGGQFPNERFDGVTDGQGEMVFANVFEGPYSSCASLTIGGTRVAGRASLVVPAGGSGEAMITLGGTGSVRGIFVAADGSTPIPFANVSLAGLAVAPTGADGRFELPDVPLGNFRITATDDQTARSGFATVVLSTPNQVVDVRITETPLGTVRGVVFSGLGNSPVAGAEVKLTLDDPFVALRTRTVTTGPDGFYSFAGVPPGGLSLDALDPLTTLRGNVRGTMPAGAVTLDVDIPLQATANLTVQVLEPDGVTPASLATVKMGPLSADTDANGRVRFENVKLLPGGLPASSQYRLQATSLRPGETRSYSFALFYPLTQGAEESLNITLRGVGSVLGTVFQGDGVTPAPGAQVQVKMQSESVFSGVRMFSPFGSDDETVIADGAGRFRFDNLPVGSLQVSAFSLAQGAREEVVLASNGQELTRNLTLTATGTVAGRVLRADGTTPAANAEVVIRFTSASNAIGTILAIVGADGRFSFTPVTVGDFSIQAALPGFNGLAVVRGRLANNGQLVDTGEIVLDEAFPQVVATRPEGTSDGVDITTTIEIDFSEAIDPTSVVTSGIFLRPAAGGPIVPATVTLVPMDGGTELRKVLLDPVQPLDSSTTYQLVVVDGDLLDALGTVTNRGPRDLVGRPLPALFSTTFKTRDQRPPLLLSFSPADGSEAVDPRTAVRLTFDEPIQPGASIVLTGPSGTVAGTTSLGLNSLALSFLPTVELPPNRSFTATVTGVRDLAGNELAGQPLGTTFATLDTLGPVIGELRIKNGLTPTAGAALTLEAVLASPETGVRYRLSANAVTVGTSAVDGLEMPFTLPATGTVVFRGIAIDRFGNEGPLAELTVNVLPNTPPVITLTRLSPATGPVATGSAVSVRLSASDDSGVTDLKAAMTGAATAALKTTTGADITLTGVVKSTAGAADVITIIAQATDTSGVGTGEQTFTIPLRDGTAPTLVFDGRVPSVGFAPGAVVSIPARGRDNFGVARYTATATGAVTGEAEIPVEPAATDDKRTLTFTLPADAPVTGEAFTLTLRAVDAAGLASAPLLVNLRTADQTPPQITAFSPANNAGNQSTRPVLTITANEALDPASVTPENVRLIRAADSAVIPATAALNAAGTVITLTPADLPLAVNTGYHLLATTGVTDAAGNALTAEAAATFTTADFRVTAPLAGLQVVEGQALTINASSGFGFPTKVRFSLNGVADGADVTSPPFQRTITVPALAAVPGGLLELLVQSRNESATLLFASVTTTVLVRGTDADSDSDGFTNAQELAAGSDPFRADADVDPDAHGLTTAREIAAGTKANDADTDDDFLTDGAELAATTDPLNPDTDGDGLLDGREALFSTNPKLADTDGDTLSDGFEVGVGRYSIVTGSFTFNQARADAASRGGHLLTVVSAKEQTAIEVVLGAALTTGDRWIGYSDSFIEGAFRWETGELASFQRFGSGEPNDFNNEDAVGIRASGLWNDFNVNTSLPYFLELGFFTDPTLPDTDGDSIRDDVDEFIGPQNAAPAAADDALFANAGETVTLEIASDLLGNDSDPDGDPFALLTFTQPTAGGTVSQPNNSTLVFTPAENFSGTAGFGYTVIDAGGLTASATVRITIGTNTRPVAGFSRPVAANHALRFDGVDDFVRSALNPAQNLAGGPWTIEAWVKPEAFNNKSFPTLYSQGFWRASLGLNASTGRFDSWANNAGQLNSTVAPPLNGWTHVAVTFDGTTRRFIVDGVEAGAFASSAVTSDNNPVYLGATGNSAPDSRSYFQGTMDEVRVWKRALSAAEIDSSSHVTLLGTESGLAAYWPFEEGAGTVTADLAGQSTATLGSTAASAPEWVASDAPVAGFRQDEAAALNTPLLIRLEGSDADGNALTGRILNLPVHGRLFQFAGGAAGAEITVAATTVSDPQRRVVYEPDPDFTGVDTFNFSVTDGGLESLPALLAVRVFDGLAPQSDDVWDVAAGAVVTASSPLAAGSPAAGAFDGAGVPVVFADGQPAGFSHFLEWETPTTVEITSARLFANDEGPASAARGFSELRLFGRLSDGDPFALLATYRPAANPYFGGLRAEVAVASFIGTQFRAEFDAAVAGSGPRVTELDAMGETVVMVPTAADIVLQNATASASQSGFPVGNLIDGVVTGSSGWAGDVGGTPPMTAVFETKDNLGTTPDTVFTFQMPQPFGSSHFVGCFRISATTSDRNDFADGLNTGGDITTNWTVLEVIEVTSTGGETITVLPDQSVLVTGNMPATTSYTIKAKGISGAVTGFRLEMLENAALPNNGPGRVGHGNWVLAEFQVSYQGGVPIPNRAPRGTPDLLETLQGIPLALTPLANDSDPDGDRLTLVSFGQPPAGEGSVTADGDTGLTYTPAAAFVGTTSSTHRTTHGFQTSKPTLVTVTVRPTAERRWINPAGGNWSVAANWLNGLIPGPDEVAVIEEPGTYTVNVDVNATISQLRLGVATGSQTLSTNSSRTLTVINGGTGGAGGRLQLNTGTLSAGGNLTVSAVAVGGGTLTGTGILTVTGGFAWTGGTMNGIGSLVIAATATGTLSGPSGKTLNGGWQLVNQGSLTMSGAGLTLSNQNGANATLDNRGTLTVSDEADIAWLNFTNQPVVVTNSGTFVKSGAGTTTVLSLPQFTNSGEIRVDSGILQLATQTSHSGVLNTSTGSTLELASGTFTLAPAATLAVGGAMRFTGGTLVHNDGATFATGIELVAGGLTVNTAIETPSLTQSGGTLGGTGILTLTGSFSWTGGTMNGTGSLVIASTATGAISGPAGKTLSGGWQLVNEGTFTLSGAGLTLSTQNGGNPTLDNRGTFTVSDEADIAWLNFTNQPVFVTNSGTFVKSGAGTTTLLSPTNFTNSGEIRVDSGILQLATQTSHSGVLNTSAGSTLNLASGTFTRAPAATLAVGGAMRFTGGTLVLNEAATFATGIELVAGGLTVNTAIETPSLTQSGGTLG
ncbi:MAG: carboxypeptidase regulatory-like domain-containing protein, partial [Akkermansiaceae bacterium]|nr:carboxypeptidase regulatory-like domain-containing protein [Akkermansiaceae bacterium]